MTFSCENKWLKLNWIISVAAWLKGCTAAPKKASSIHVTTFTLEWSYLLGFHLWVKITSILCMILNYSWSWGLCLRHLKYVEYPFITITPSPLTLGEEIPVRVPSRVQKELYKSISCKQLTDIKLKCWCYTAMIKTI